MQHSRRIILQSTIFGIFLSFAIIPRAQELWGITTSNYAGSTGALLNPSSMTSSKLYMDINIVTADVFIENNYAYIHKQDYSFFKLISGNPTIPKYGPDEMPFDHYYSTKDKYIYSSEMVKGPSCMVSMGRHAFAIHTGARVLTSAYGIPHDIANFGYYGLDYLPQQNKEYTSSNFGSSALVMGEVGLSYAYAFRKIGMDDWSAGITVKRLFSVAGAYLRASDLDYMVLNDSTINIKNLNAEVGYSVPLDYDNNDFPDSGPWIKGGGFGMDLGLTYQRKTLSYQKKRVSKLCRQKYIDYSYKIGISLIDFGFVNFTKNAQLHSFIDVSKYWINIDTLNYYNLNELSRTLSQVFYGDPDASYVDNKIRVFLPAAFSIQADYKLYRNWYAGAVFIQPIRLGKSYIRRPPQIAFIPRYETPHFEFAVPVSFYDYYHMRLGASVRYYFLTIGSDDMLGLFGVNDFTGLDLYVSVKINFRKGNCGRLKHYLPCENDEYGIRTER